VAISESEIRAGLESLTPIERLLCRRLIVRQLRFSRRVERDLRDFGPTGLIKISSARAGQLSVFVLVVVAAALGFAQVSTPVLITIWTLILLMYAFVLVRSFTAAREAKRYRRHRSAPDLPGAELHVHSERVRQPEGLIQVLLDSHARQDERWDAAGDLDDYPTPEAVAALASIATSAEVAEADETLAEIAAASLATIWAALGAMDYETYDVLPGLGHRQAEAILRARAPQLLDQRPGSDRG
jgi:hypothetical protein